LEKQINDQKKKDIDNKNIVSSELKNSDIQKIYVRIGKSAAKSIPKHSFWSVKAHNEQF